MQESIMTTPYGYSVRVEASFEEAVSQVRSAFATETFGVLSEIDVKAKMREKLGKDMEDYVILGMCNPALAYEALRMETEIGLLLPCNVIVYRKDGETHVSAQRPQVILAVTGNESIAAAAEEADKKILRAIRSLAH